jgi:hypothetical protein
VDKRGDIDSISGTIRRGFRRKGPPAARDFDSMTTKLAVTVSVDMDASSVTVRPSRRLTSDNVRGLLTVARRAERRARLPGVGRPGSPRRDCLLLAAAGHK